MTRSYIWWIAVAITLILLGGGLLLFLPQPAAAPEDVAQDSQPSPLPTSSAPKASPPTQTRTLVARDIPGVSATYTFSATMPAAWQAEALPAIEAINIYDPAAAGSTNLEKSQIFIRHFSGNDFLTLSTVTIHNRRQFTLSGRPAVEYDIEKKVSAANFPNQPSWRNQRHIVTDVRVSDTNPSTFYVIAKRSDLDNATYQQFLSSLQVNTAAQPISEDSEIQEPIADMKNRITKKPFGIFITPQNSPVQPERFSGYHTGVDVEYDDVSGDVPVKAIAAGEVTAARDASGYGGVVVIRHKVDGEQVQSLYGHLDPSSIPSVGTSVTAGQQIGMLGEGETNETDGERKHLHFAIIKGATPDIRGYVQNQSELSAWHDPIEFLGL